MTRAETPAILAALILAGLLTTACNRSEAPTDQGLTTEQIIQKYRSGVPMEKAIGPIARALASGPVFSGTDGQDSGDPRKINLKTNSDREGRQWLYAYSSQAEFSKAFPQGGPFVEMSFADLLGIAEANPQFAGIYINSASDGNCPILREQFRGAKEALRGGSPPPSGQGN